MSSFTQRVADGVEQLGADFHTAHTLTMTRVPTSSKVGPFIKECSASNLVRPGAHFGFRASSARHAPGGSNTESTLPNFSVGSMSSSPYSSRVNT
jgi:hypothetical protein